MKKPIQQVLLGAIVLAATVTASTAAVNITGTPNVQSWAATPLKGDWLSYQGTGVAGSLADQAALNAAVGAVDHAAALEGGVNTDLLTNVTGTAGSVGNDWYSRNSKGRHNTADQIFQFALGANDNGFGFLQARARNQTGASLSFIDVSFDLSIHTPAAGVVGPLAGVSVYYSLSDIGAASTWQLIPGFGLLNTTAQASLGQSQTFSTTLDISATPEAAGSDLYFRWAVDNVVGDDIQYRIDNNTFTAVPEPSTGLLAASAAAALGFIRRRRK